MDIEQAWLVYNKAMGLSDAEIKNAASRRDSSLDLYTQIYDAQVAFLNESNRVLIQGRMNYGQELTQKKRDLDPVVAKLFAYNDEAKAKNLW